VKKNLRDNWIRMPVFSLRIVVLCVTAVLLCNAATYLVTVIVSFSHSKAKRNMTSDHKNHHSHFTALFPGLSGWASARRETFDFMVQGKINRGRHTDHPAGRHSVRINQCPPPLSLHFLQAGCPSCHPANSVKALKATSTFGLGRRC